MGELKIEYIPIGELKTYVNNAKIHTAEQVEQIKKSIEEFGFNDPIALWSNNEIIEGHGRLIAATELGMKEVPVIRLDTLTDEERRAYMLVHNKLTMNTSFDFDVLNEELAKLKDEEMESYGFEIVDEGSDEAEEEYATEETDEEPEEHVKTIICPRCGKVVAVLKKS